MGDVCPRVALLGDFLFPYGDAASNRVLAMAKALRDLGWRPVALGRGPDGAEAVRGSVEGIEHEPYTSIDAGSFAERLRRPERALEREMENGGLRAVLLYASASWPFAPRLIRFCRGRGLPLAADVTERYGPAQFPRGLLDARFHLFSLAFSAYFHRIRHLVVASRHLEEHFSRKGCRTLRIPALVDCAAVRCGYGHAGGRLRLIYAGSPGRKDLVGRALCGLLRLSGGELERVSFDLYGPAQAWLAAQLGGRVPERLRESVRAHGLVPAAEVSERLAGADFAVLLREDRRFTRAGFPSKVAESLAHGVPLLANSTGDMGLYLKDGRECLEAAAPTAEAFAAAVRRALALPPARLVEMKRAARRRAEEDFDYRNYAGALDALLREACAGGKAGAGR